ncbi:MAG: hypothetical protein IJZ64_07975 [Ruminococcus sp.]|nr:hypothetical protein [Ruminococcus sp.]
MKVKKICIMILATTMFLSSVGCADDEETSSTSLIIGSTTPVEDLPPADFLSHLDESYFSEINFDNTDTSMLNSELVFHDISFSINNDWKKEEVSEDSVLWYLNDVDGYFMVERYLYSDVVQYKTNDYEFIYDISAIPGSGTPTFLSENYYTIQNTRVYDIQYSKPYGDLEKVADSVLFQIGDYMYAISCVDNDIESTETREFLPKILATLKINK